MWELDNIKTSIQNNEPLRLSSGLAKWGSILSVVVVAFGALIIMGMIQKEPMIKTRHIIAVLLLVTFAVLVLVRLVLTVDAILEGKQLYINKLLGGKYEINVSQIEHISYFAMRSTQYTYIKFRDSQGVLNKALIMGSNSVLFGRDIPAAQILKLSQLV